MAEPPSGASTPSVCSPNFAPYEYECSPTGASTPFERSPVLGPGPAVLPLLDFEFDFDLRCHETMSSPPDDDHWSVDDCLSPAHARAKSMAMPELELPASAVLSFVSVERTSVIRAR
jgi:hypothetical protein